MHLVENCIMILLPFISHLLMVIPFWVTGGSFRTTMLAQQSSRGTERRGDFCCGEAGFHLLGVALAIVVSSLLDLFLVIAFQKWLHPWRRIIAKSNKVEEIGEKKEYNLALSQ